MFSFIKRVLTPQADHRVEHEEMLVIVDKKTHFIIDVREPHEYAVGHVPGATNIPLSRFKADEIKHEKPVVLICQAGGRSAKALSLLKNANHPDARHYAPGTGGWRARGGQLA